MGHASSPTARALQLLELLQSAEIRSVPELAERLGVDERTVRRSVQRLVDMDVPIESVRGRYGGYRLAVGRRVSPVMLTDEEAAAVFLGLSEAQSTSDSPDVAAQIALAKIRRSLPAASVDRLEAVLQAAARRPTRHDVPDAGVLLTVSDAIRARRPVELRYRDAEDTPSRRTVHPFDLLVHAGRWYLDAFDVERAEERTFRVDRIRSARTLPGVVSGPIVRAERPPLFDRFAGADYRWHVRLRIQASVPQIRAYFPESVAVVEPIEDAPAWHRVSIRAKRLDWLPAVIAGLGDHAVIVDEPEDLRALLHATATRMLRIARGVDGAPSIPE
ncbi:helix-turn-helix transcriptional regulator [Plantibacter sp. CFBP 8804]|uniref:helix-turn-helix transcriptional regulator n=1 Tax=Plantibacter sp. CFBP 8804 TaxID=2775270 RepID=UPI0017811267|nr:YafY family protein [Plantibacter sp. CFBP 8804]MBD8515316.1 YafY family transcriptional regulator [Plantibacter sp. CFBP 8804]